MTANPYQVLGPSPPRMLGRAALLRRIDDHLLKPSPDHVSVVGPAHYGKSVLLRHLADVPRVESNTYLTTVHIDLRHGTPKSDRAFKQRFAEEVKLALHPHRTELSGILELEDEAIHESLDLVFTELKNESTRILVVLDGFDNALAGTGLTRNLWDQLRSLAQKPSLRLVTGSRRPLRELCRTEESRTSDFWEIFYDTPIRVAALDDSDWESFLRPLLDAGCKVDESARKELSNWTGGVPLLVCALLQKLWEAHRGTHLSKREVDQASETVSDERRGVLEALWDDCDVELRADLGTLATADIPLADLSDGRRRALENRGFGRVLKKHLRGSCRLMQSYAREQAPALADLTRLFGDDAGFEAHIRTLLELRFSQVARAGIDRELYNFVNNAIRDIEPRPEHALTWTRSITNRALALIWEVELPPDRRFPEDWVNQWNRNGVSFPEDQGKLPHGSGAQCHVLRLITGTGGTARRSKYVTKTTFLLVDHLQSIGDFGQHRADYPEARVPIGVAAAFVFAAISLVESLTADLHR